MMTKEYNEEKFNAVVDRMVIALNAEAKRAGVDEGDVRKALKEDINYLDDVFDDVGVARVEHFVDLGMDFASEYGSIDSSLFDDVLWDLIEEAIDRF